MIILYGKQLEGLNRRPVTLQDLQLEIKQIKQDIRELKNEINFSKEQMDQDLITLKIRVSVLITPGCYYKGQAILLWYSGYVIYDKSV